MSLKDKKTRLILGGGVALAIILSLGIGLGVGLSGITNSNPEKQIVKIVVNKQSLQERLTLFLSLGLDEEAGIQAKLEKLKVELDDETADIEELGESIALQIRSHLKNQREVIDSEIEDIENEEGIVVFDEVDTKLTDLKDKKTKLQALLNNENVGKEFLNGTVTEENIQEVVFEGLEKETSAYATELTQYKTSLLQLKVLIQPAAETTTLDAIQTIYDKVVSKDIKISKVQEDVKGILKTLINEKMGKQREIVNVITFDEKDRYTDLKANFDAAASNIESLERLDTYIEENIEDLLKDTLNTQFANFETIINIDGVELSQKFRNTRRDIADRLGILRKVASGMTETGFSAAIFNELTTRAANLAALNTGFATINGGLITLDEAINELTRLEDGLYNKILTYKEIGLKTQKLKASLPAESDSSYPAQKSVVDYFSSKKEILRTFSTEAGITGFNRLITNLENIATKATATKDNIKNKIDALLALTLTKDTTIEAALAAFKTQIDAANANVATISASLNTKMSEYLTVHLNAIKARIKEIEDNSIEVFDDVASELKTLKEKQATIEGLNTNTLLADILVGKTILSKISQTVFSRPATTNEKYIGDLAKYKTNLLHIKTKFENVSEEVQTSIQTIHDNLEAKTIKISDVWVEMRKLLLSFVLSTTNERIALISSISDTDKNLYSDIKAIVDIAITEKRTLDTLSNLLEVEAKISMKDLLLRSTADIDTSFNIASTITTENKELIEGFITNRKTLRTRSGLIEKIKSAFGQSWVTDITDFPPSRETLITDITTYQAITTYEGLLGKLTELEDKIYNDILSYRSISTNLDTIKTTIDSLLSTPTDPTYMRLKKLYDYFKNKEGVLKDLSTESGITRLLENTVELEGEVPSTTETTTGN